MSEEPEWPASANLDFVEQLYADYLRDPASVPGDWRRYFEEMDGEHASKNGKDHGFRLGPSFTPPRLFGTSGGQRVASLPESDSQRLFVQDRVDQMIRAFRVRGHLVANLDPLGRPRQKQRTLDPDYYGLTEAHMDVPCSTINLGGPDVQTVREIIDRLRNTYCRNIGVQYRHIDDPNIRHWLEQHMESTCNRIELSRELQVHILTRLTDAVIFEEFIRRKYVGSKSFSLEGGESLIPLLDMVIEHAADQDVQDIVIGMAHRGRLNVLANILRKSPQLIFHEFEDSDPDLYRGGGDVKYHKGYINTISTRTGRDMNLTMCFNPSHLEYVNTVAMGRVRAKQDRKHDATRQHSMCILIHGDAAFAGEGVVQETLNLSDLEGYRIGGTLHVIVNNQIGFTTPPEQARCTEYCSAVAKMLQIPIFHVNGEDCEAVAQAVKLAMEFRARYKRDAVIDMYCYRLHGHNETDEPMFTQPKLYKLIRARRPLQEAYQENLVRMGQVTQEEADQIAADRRAKLEHDLAVARNEKFVPKGRVLGEIWNDYCGGPLDDIPEPNTGENRDWLACLLEVLTRVPEGFEVHRTLARWIEARREMAFGKRKLDWSAAEALAYATLATEGYRVRLTGQDALRGTFSHRHAMFHDVETGATYCPLEHLAPDQATVEIVNSPLQETGVLGFEYGYSLEWPDGLILWEAQFGDFINSAQVIVDQFIASAEDKWRVLSGLVMLLPHGFDGQGPEHSSARLERFLQLAAEDNMQVVNLTTPAQFFHVLRRQVLWVARKPLVVMSPKSLLRNALCVSSLEDLAEGRFQKVIPDDTVDPTKVEKILLCSGQIYYDLDRVRRDVRRDDVAIIRVEQLYPIPRAELGQALAPYADGTPTVWVQEEPENMGAWYHLLVHLGDALFDRFPLSVVARAVSASPATGSGAAHRKEQAEILDKAFEVPAVAGR